MNLPFTPPTAPITIVVTIKPTVVSGLPGKAKRKRLVRHGVTPTAEARVAGRWAAEFVGGPHAGESVAGHYTPDEAVGALIRECAAVYETADEVLDFFAKLFGFDPARTPDVLLARAVRLAARNPRRVHPGVRVDIQEYDRAEATRAKTSPAPRALALAKGGVS